MQSKLCVCKSEYTQQIRKVWNVLADRTNGRAIGTVLRPSVVCRRLYGMYYG